MPLNFSFTSQGSGAPVAAPKKSGVLNLGSSAGTPIPGSVPQNNSILSASMNPNATVSLGSNPGMIKPTTPLKKTTTNNVDGSSTVHEYHAPPPTAAELAANTKKNNAANYGPAPTQTQPNQVGTTKENAQNVINSGFQTPQEQTATQQLYQAGQMTPQEKAANDEVARANALQKSYQNVSTLSPYAEATMYSDRARTPEEIQALEQSPDLVGRASTTNGLLNNLSNIYGSSRVAGANAALQGIQTAAGRGLSAATSGLAGAQTQAGRLQSGLGTVFGAGLPGQISGSARTYNPLDPAGTNGTNGIVQGANNQSIYDLQSAYNQGLVSLKAADGIQQQIIGTLQNTPELNQTPLSSITNLNELISGQVSSGPQQLLSQQIAQYISQLGLDPATVVSIAHQQQGTLAQLLDSLRQTAQTNNEAKNPANLNLGGSNSSGGASGGSSSGTTSAGGFNFKLVNGTWVPA